MVIKFFLKSFVVSIALLGLFGCKSKNSQTAMPHQSGLPARVAFPEVRQIFEWQKYTGRFEASKRVNVSSRVSGYIKEIKFEDGQEVKKGDILFVIDQRSFKIALASAQARFDLALKKYNRAIKLEGSKAISRENFDTVYNEMQVAKSVLDNAKLNLEFTEVKASLSGRIDRNFVDEGNLVIGDTLNPTPLTTIVVTSPILFYFEWSESEFLQYIKSRDKLNWPVYVKLQNELDYSHEGHIDFISNEFDAETGTIQARAIFNNESGALESGLFGRVRIATTRKPFDALLIPETIIQTEQNFKYVYVIDKESKAKRNYLTLGSVTEDGYQVVLKGLEKNDQVIVGNLHMIQPGMSIAPIKKERPDEERSG